jgi:hypothetical protein
MRTVLAVMTCAVVACGIPSTASAQTQALTAPGFTTQFPSDWTQAKHKVHGFTLHTLMSPGTTMTSYFHSIPKSGGVAVTVSTETAAHFKRTTGHTAPKRGLAMVHAVGIPAKARHIKVVSKAATFKLDGVVGVTLTATYTYGGVKNLQRDVAARKGNRLVLIELNCRPDLEQAGQAGMSVVLANWHWS